jgi:hypothetical protein
MATSEQIKLLLESHYKNDEDRFTYLSSINKKQVDLYEQLDIL